jgi:Ca2+-binding EF-hand superfamily protein
MNNAWNLDGTMSANKKKGWKGEEKGGSAASNAPARGGASRGGARGGTSGGARGGASASAEAEAPAMNMTEAQLMDRFRTKLAARGNRGIMGLGRSFKIADDDRSGSLGMEEFQKAIHDFRVGLQPAQSAKLYKVFDRDGSGSIDYDEFLRGVRGVMNDFRKGLAMKAFKIMDKDHSGVLDIDDIRQRYNAKMHPDVKAGKKTEDEILYEFIDTFEQHHSDNKEDSRDGKVSGAEWVEYYNNVSMSVDRDDYFELMMNNAWNLKGDRVTKAAWGAEV